MITIVQARHEPRSLRLSLLIRLELAGSRVNICNGTLGFPMKNQDLRHSLRQTIRNTRKALSEDSQVEASLKLVRQCQTLPELVKGQRIGLYLHTDGELNTGPLIDWLWQQNKSVYLPVIHPFSKGHLLFLTYTPGTTMINNQYHIPEPRLEQSQLCPVANLDVIFTPLVGFDDNGHRLGMGGGYYDRTLAPWFEHRTGPKPIGLAHDCQQVENIPTEIWDVPLPKIITPTKIWSWE